MARKPEPPQPICWDIYRAASKVKWIGSVEAADADAAIESGGQRVQDRCVAADRSAAVTTWTFQNATDGQDCKFRDTDAELMVRLSGRDTV
jgi:hypothetical protein